MKSTAIALCQDSGSDRGLLPIANLYKRLLTTPSGRVARIRSGSSALPSNAVTCLDRQRPLSFVGSCPAYL